MVEMIIFGANKDISPPCVVLKEKESSGEERYLVIGANSQGINILNAKLRGISFQRPPLHAVAYTIIKELGAKISCAVITDIKDGYYYTNLCLRAAEKEIIIPCQCGDAIVFCAGEAPIFCEEEVLEEAGWVLDESGQGLRRINDKYLQAEDSFDEALEEETTELERGPFGDAINDIDFKGF